MSSKKNNLPAVPDDLATPTPREVKGLTISEIRYQRALVALQKEFCKEKVSSSIRNLKNTSPFSKNYSPSTKAGRYGAIASRILGGINYLDYAVIGFSVFSNVRKIMSFFRKKK